MEASENNHSNGSIAIEGVNGGDKEVMGAKKRTFTITELVLRGLGFAFTLVAAIVLGVDKQNTYISLKLIPTLPALDVPVTAEWHYLSALVYFVVTNSIACSYAAISLVLITMANGGNKRKGLALIIMICDIIIIALLFSGGGAAIGVGLIGFEGNSRLQWKMVCNMFGKFCHQVAAAIALSGVGSLVFLLLALVAVLKLHKKH